MAAAWWADLAGGGWVVALTGAALALVLWRFRPRAAVPVALAIGLLFAWDQLSLVDDAFITFRYAKHWTSGLGPVWNEGERVEGITNFGWLVLLSLVHLGTRLSLEHVALLLCAASYVGLVAVTAGLERALDPSGPRLAAVLVALQYGITSYASTGLETEAAAALVVAGALAAFRREDTVGAALAGACWIAAGLVRMDHLIAYAIGAAWLAWRHRRFAVADREALAAFAACALPWAGVHAWKLWFYGSILPNTYYAKSAHLWYPTQGLVYTFDFYAASGLWLALVPALAWPILSAGRERALAVFATTFTVAWHVYVFKVGGDFMAGRFLVPVVPWLLVGAVRAAAALRPRAGLAVVALAGATLRGGSLLTPFTIRWGLTDEGTCYVVNHVHPLEIEHHSFREGRALGEHFAARGLRPVVATSGIGMVGFYSDLEIVDMLGLTDAVIARTPVRRRGRPGHEKVPPEGYLDERGVDLVRVDVYRPVDEPRLVAELRRVDVGPVTGRWSLYTFDPELWARVARESPGVRFQRFAPFVRNRVLPAIPRMTRADADRMLRELDRLYWDRNGEDVLRARLVEAIEKL